MPTCQKCNYTWTYSESLKKMFTISTSMICPNCNEKQYPSKKTRNKSVFLIFFSITIAFGLAFIFGASLLNVAILFVLFAIYVCIYPFTLELQNEEMEI